MVQLVANSKPCDLKPNNVQSVTAVKPLLSCIGNLLSFIVFQE